MNPILVMFKSKRLPLLVLIVLLFSQIYSQDYTQPNGLKDIGIEYPKNEYNVPKSTDPIFSNGIVYIDPDWTGKESGTLNEPFNSWNDFIFEANTAYLQKRNTEFKGKFGIQNIESNVLFGAYGEGERPIIQALEINIGGYKNVFRDILVKCFFSVGTIIPTGSHSWVYNCEMDGSSHDGDLLVVWTHHNKIIGNYIHDGLNEGIFMKDNISGGVGNEIAYNHIVRINRAWYPGATQKVADGDGIQVTTNDSLHIHHNIIDRSNSGNKFCIIINDEPGYYNGSSVHALIEQNVLILPKTTDEGGAGIYLGAPHKSIIRHNRIYSYESTKYLSAIYIGSSVIDVEVCGNLVVNAKETLHTPDGSKIRAFNNTLINVAPATEAYWSYFENNIFPVSHSDLSSSNIFIDQYGLDSIFIDPSINDYRLKEGSPAINAGINSNYTMDICGDNVPANAIDVGAYEYGVSKVFYPSPINQKPPTHGGNDKPVVEIYPNPAGFNFSIDLKADSFVRIINMYGKIEFAKYFSLGISEITPNLRSGNYIIQVNNNNNTVSKPLIIL